MKPLNTTVEQFKESIFSTMTKLALENKAINLSQGFPDFDGPSWVIDLAVEALKSGNNQYAPAPGVLSLREAIANNYKRFYGLEYNASTEIIVTVGATEAIYCTCMALLNEGDEVIVLEPCYDSYIASIQLAKAKIVPVTLKAPEFKFDIEELKSAISSKTKLLIINNPHNPTGKVFTSEEIKTLGTLARENDFYILSDEPYEFLTYGVDHVPTAKYDDLRERTITISSTAKTFGLTGWKIGWTAAPAHLTKAILNVHQWTTFCVSHPMQVAIAKALTKIEDYLPEFKASYQKKRDLLVNGLKDLGYNVINPKGTFFALVQLPEGENDVDFCKRLIVEKKVAVIPTSAFYLKSDEGKRIVRFCFAKTDETLKAALENLK